MRRIYSWFVAPENVLISSWIASVLLHNICRFSLFPTSGDGQNPKLRLNEGLILCLQPFCSHRKHVDVPYHCSISSYIHFCFFVVYQVDCQCTLESPILCLSSYEKDNLFVIYDSFLRLSAFIVLSLLLLGQSVHFSFFLNTEFVPC